MSSQTALQSDEILEVVKILPDVLFRCYKKADGKIYWSLNEGGLAQEFGLTTTAIEGMSLHDLFPGGASPELEEHFELAFQGISTIFTNEIEGRHFRHYPKPIMGPDGKVAEVVGYIAEVTDLVHTQNELEQANLELDAFVHAVSHDLRNPLTVITTLASLTQRTYADTLDEKGQQGLQRMIDTANAMQGMTRALLDLSTARNAQLAREELDLSAMAQEQADALSTSHPDKVVEYDIQPGMTVEADRALVRVLLQNLVGNAWKYCDAEQPKIAVLHEDTPRGTAFVVRDNGRGFDASKADELFEAFRRDHTGPTEGHGIGLSTVRRIVHRHGGDVWATGDQGASFWFTL